MNALGPFPMRAVLVAVAALAAWWLVRLLAVRFTASDDKTVPKLAGSLFADIFLVGLLAARIGYVLRWWPEYAAAPKSIIAIGDGGFLWWTGLPVALAFSWWRTRKQTRLRRPLLIGIAAGLLTWLAASGVLTLLRPASPLPNVAASTLDGEPVALADRTGRPVVLNLWATWCPPCRREMPVFEDAAKRHPGVEFVLLNQGEDAATVRDFLERQGLELHGDVLLDPHSQAMSATGTRGLPTTLFFDANGHLVDVHMGELTRASLTDTLRDRFGSGTHGPSSTRQ